MPGDFDFDPRESILKIGIEVEYPICSTGEYLVGRGRGSNPLRRQIEDWPHTIGGYPEYDGTVGLEVVSDVLDLADAANWYADVLDHIEHTYGERYQPVGLMSGGNTAGTHIHISDLTESQAQELYDISQTPWAKVLFCSSIASDDDSASWPVFRGGQYCRMGYGSNRYNVVNHRGGGHYEWRLPEPMIREHMEIVVRFLRLFEQSPDEAREYAQELLDSGDDRITSIRRAERVGMDIDEMPTVQREPVTADSESEQFYQRVEDDWALPEIHTVEFGGESFYVFESRLSGEFEVMGIEFADDDILHALSLQPVDDAMHEEIQRAYQRDENIRKTEATTELKKIVKKKKGKA